MGRLSFCLLGAPGIYHAGALLKFPTRKALGLLVYLAVEGGTHAREKLVTLFWPESDSQKGRAVLRNTLAYVNNALRAGGGSPHLIADRDSLAFDFDSEFDLDLHHLRGVRFGALRVDASPAPAAWQAAVEAYRGDFLEGFSLSDAPAFDDWATVQRERWHVQMAAIFDRLTHWQSEAGELARAVEMARRWVAHDALNEAAHRRLIQTLLAAGERTAALQAYEVCKAILAEELAAEPSPETETLMARVRAREGTAPRRPIAPLGGARIPLPEMPFVGRAAEHLQLVTIYHAARQGRASAVAILGEAGIGKTRLATEFLSWAESEGTLVLRGRAFESGGRLPYQPVMEALRSALSAGVWEGGSMGATSPTLPHSQTPTLSPTWLAELARLLPELRERYPDAPERPPDDTTAQTLLFEAVVRLVEALAASAPVILFVDDLQWADAASLDLLRYASRRWATAGTRVLLLLPLRSEALLTNPALMDWLASLGRDLPLTRLELEALTADNTLRLVQLLEAGEHGNAGAGELETFPVPKPPKPVAQFGHWLFAETRGQPFYIAEMLKDLFERGELRRRPRHPGGEWGLDFNAVPRTSGRIPASVRDVIRARLARLTPTASAVLAAGAVLGQRFNFEQLCRLTEASESVGLPALDELLRGRLLLEANAGYVFAHDRIRDVAYTEAGEARRRVFHRRAVEALRASAPAAELAHHALAAGLLDQAFRFSLAAGDEALRLFAVRDAIAHYEQARELSESAAASDLRHLHGQLGRAYQLNSEPEKARPVYEAMLAAARALPDPAMECAALNYLATLVGQQATNFAQAGALLQEALRIAETGGDRAGLAETEWNLAQLGLYASDPRSALEHGGRALALARELDLPELVARSLNAIAYSELASGKWEEAERHAEEARALYAALGNRALEADCLGIIANLQIRTGRLPAGIATAQTLLAISRKIENLWGQLHGIVYLASGLSDAGEYAEALRVAQQGVALTQAQGLAHWWQAMMRINLGSVYRAVLDLNSAQQTHREALALSEREGLPSNFTGTIAAELCADCALTGAWDEAYTYAQRALATRHDEVLPFGFSRWPEVEALVRAGELERAAAEARRFGELVGHNSRYRLLYLRTLAALTSTPDAFPSPEPTVQERGGLTGAGERVKFLREAIAIAEELGLPGELWQLYAALGEWGRAQEIVQSLAERIQDEQLRAIFLASEPVQHVLKNSGQ